MFERLSQRLNRIATVCGEKESVTLKEFVHLIGPRAPALITLILALPFLLPIPLPGLSIPFGCFILLNGFRIVFKKELWFPLFVLKRRMTGRRLEKILHKGAHYSKWFEKFIRPRGKFLYQHPALCILNGSILALCGLFLALPLPPGTNFPPALTTVLMSLGILEEDGLCIILGYLTFLINLAIFTFIFVLGVEGIEAFFTRH